MSFEGFTASAITAASFGYIIARCDGINQLRDLVRLTNDVLGSASRVKDYTHKAACAPAVNKTPVSRYHIYGLESLIVITMLHKHIYIYIPHTRELAQAVLM